MELNKYFRDGTNLGIGMPRYYQSKSVNSNNNLNTTHANKENIKFVSTTKDETVVDISMLSLREDESKISYKLPDSNDLKSSQFHKQWIADMKNRRWANRLEVCSEMTSLERRLQDISFDDVTGERFLMETLDYRMDLEVSKMPLGRNFLQNTNITPRDRKKIIDILYNTCDRLSTDRYTVPMAMASVDRYVMEKGKKLLLADYTNIAFTCWFLACKFDLICYPSIDDLCALLKLNDTKTLVNLEVDILKTLNFYIAAPTPIEFLRPLTLLKQRDGISHNIAKFFIDVSLYVYEIAAHPAHIIAAASYCLSLAISFRMDSIENTWSNLMKIFTGIDLADIKPIISIIGHAIVNTNFALDLPTVHHVHSTVIEVLSKRHIDIMRLARP